MRGSIRKRGANSWRLIFDIDTGTGRRKQRTVTVRGSYKDAQKELTRLLGEADAGALPDPTKMTVADYVTAYLDATVKQSPKTLERYRELAERQVIPHLGSIKLQRLSLDAVHAWHATLLKTLAPRTVIHAHHVLSLVLGRAVKSGILRRNVAADADLPKVDEREIEILTKKQIEQVLAALDGNPLHPIVSLALSTGMRRGELLALEWRNVDLDRAVLRVERSVEETKAGLRVKPPKTAQGRRGLKLPAEAVAMLREHRKRQIELRLQIGQGGQPTLVFSTIEGAMLSPDNISRDWRRTVLRLKLPQVSFHALRHTHASMLLRAGVDVFTVSRRLGHRKPSVTLDVYGHLIEGADADAAKAIEGALK